MEINKKYGYWSIFSTRLDDIAYSFYIKDYDNEYRESFTEMCMFGPERDYDPYTQDMFIRESFRFENYYKKANIIIREDKIKKLFNNYGGNL